LAEAVGIDSVINVARRMGITADLEPNLSLALGSSEVPMIQMAQAYATINSGGYAIKAYGITKIKTGEGKVLFEYKPEVAPRVFRGSDIGVLTNMMMSVVQNGTGQAAQGGFFAAGKTGTSQDYHDAWFDGFSRDYVAVVWFGNDNNSSMKSMTGGAGPARAWRDIILAAKSDPTPAKYALLKDESFSSDFSDLLGNLISSPFPDMHDGAGQAIDPNTGNPIPISPRFTPDKLGDRVGYGRFND
jgi:penicillin-binding protein 1A